MYCLSALLCLFVRPFVRQSNRNYQVSARLNWRKRICYRVQGQAYPSSIQPVPFLSIFLSFSLSLSTSRRMIRFLMLVSGWLHYLAQAKMLWPSVQCSTLLRNSRRLAVIKKVYLQERKPKGMKAQMCSAAVWPLHKKIIIKELWK